MVYWQGKEHVLDSALWLTERTLAVQVHNDKQVELLSTANVFVSNNAVVFYLLCMIWPL